MEPLIRGISDTARWVAIFRAEETERPDALFHDRLARRLAGERGQQIADAIEFSRKHSWSAVARTWLFDEYISRHVAKGVDTVVDLAAGLDARPYRMNLPPSLKWIEVDLPEIIAYKEAMLAGETPVCQLERVPLDLSNGEERRRLFHSIDTTAGQALIVAEGLIVYLDDTEVRSLAADLSAHPTFRHWVFDLISPGLLWMVQEEMGTILEAGDAPMQFAPDEGEDFVRAHGWTPIESRSNLKTAAQLKRLPDAMLEFAAMPEPEGSKGEFPWSGVCLAENTNRQVLHAP
jgi:methyltransferase (TIGR00027 family)